MITELHRHLDVSIRLSTLLELAQERGLEGHSTSLGEFRKKIVLTCPLKNLREVLAQFQLCQKVLDRPEVLERVAFEVVEDCYLEGTRAVELRYGSSFVSEFSGLTWEDILDSFERGIARAQTRYPEMKAGLLCIAVRDEGVDGVAQAVEFYSENRTRFIGLDLAGNEDMHACRLYESVFKKVSGAPITIHAGEASGPENIWEAIECLGARRIGHGVSAIQDPKLIEALISQNICLEMCPTSNWITGAVQDLGKHPLLAVLTRGVKACFNTDDPTIFGTTISQEAEISREKIGLSPAQVDLCYKNAREASFLQF